MPKELSEEIKYSVPVKSKLTFMYATNNHKAMYRCECGNEKEIQTGSVRIGKTISCGCYRKQYDKVSKITHGLSNHPLYNIWRSMLNRCYNVDNKYYEAYGKRGVVVCDEWKNDFVSYYNWALANGWEKGLQIDKDIKGDGKLYSPETCCCVTRKENNRYHRRTIMVEHNGQIKNLREISFQYGVSYNSLWRRIKKKGWSLEESLITSPINNK
jgi:hypothetical protein